MVNGAKLSGDCDWKLDVLARSRFVADGATGSVRQAAGRGAWGERRVEKEKTGEGWMEGRMTDGRESGPLDRGRKDDRGGGRSGEMDQWKGNNLDNNLRAT